jgi:HD-GYP domain-containing protein (c-di-GMP phosphodiesterase class II)
VATQLTRFFAVAPIPQYEQDQRKRTLAAVLWTTLVACTIIGFVNLYLHAMPETAVLFGAAALCVPAILLNARGRYVVASMIATALVAAAIEVNLYSGNGIHDPGIAAVPIFLMFGALLFGRRSVPFFLAAGLAAIAVTGYLEIIHIIQPNLGANVEDMIVLLVLVLAAGLVVWVMMGNLEKNLERSRESERELRIAYDRTLEGWAKALEFRDEETEGHTRRVVSLCVRLAQEWQFDEEQMAHIYRGALLHDIGKMAMPDKLLFKRGPLNPRERHLMKKHTEYSRDMLAAIPFLKPALNIPTYHHERWDGKGYPRGLKGRQIPIEARIFAVVDHYEALSSSRPYRRAWPRTKILRYIREEAGKAFDPEVAAVFLRLHEAGAFGGNG